MTYSLHEQVINYIKMKTTTKYSTVHKYPDIIENKNIKDLRATYQEFKKWNDIPLKNTIYFHVTKIIADEMFL